jgi:hypothetical protein
MTEESGFDSRRKQDILLLLLQRPGSGAHPAHSYKLLVYFTHDLANELQGGEPFLGGY